MKLHRWGAREVFKRLDYDGDPTISAAELRRGLQVLYKGGPSGSYVSLQEAEDIVRSIHVDGKRLRFSLQEFETWCQGQEAIRRRRHNLAREAHEPMLRLFQVMAGEGVSSAALFTNCDVHETGSITVANLYAGCGATFMSAKFSTEEVQQIFHAMDYNGKGTLSQEEWIERYAICARQAVRLDGNEVDKEALTYGAGHDKAKTIMRGPQAAREAAYKRWLGRRGKTKVLTPFQQKQQAAEAWRPVTDEKTGGTYWYHKKSRETTWETPEAVQAWDQAKQEAVITPERVYDHYLRLRGFMRDNSTMPRELYHRIDFQGSGKICAATLRRGLHCLYKSGRAGCYIPLQETVDITAAILAESGADGDDEGALDDPLYRGPFFSVEQFEIWCTKMEALWTRRQILARNAQQSFYLLFKQMAISKMTDEQLAGQLDVSKKGRLTLTNIRASLNTIFEPDTFTDEDADHIFAAIDWDSVGHVELEIWLRRFKVNMQQAVQQEGTKNELEALTLGAGTGCGMTIEEAEDITMGIIASAGPERFDEADKDGFFSMEQMESWCQGQEAVFKRRSALVHEARHGYHTIFRVMLEQGISPEQLFESMDPLSIGSLTTTELQGGLKMAFAPYKIDVTDQEYLDIVTALDFESSGAISATVWAQRFPANAREAVQFVGSAEEKAAARFGAGSLRAKNLVCGARTSSATAIKDSSVNGFGRWLTSRAAAEQLEARRRPVWVPTRDEKTGKPYWYHRITKETSWNEPTDLFEQPQEEEHKVDAQQSYHHYLRLRACMKENTLKPRDVYHRIDFNGDGHIDAAELRRGLHFMYKAGRMGCHISLAEAEAMIYEILARSYSPGDEQLRGSRITVAEFEVCASVLYDQFDVDGSDSISPAEMSLGLARMFRHEFSPYDVQQIFDSLDTGSKHKR
eukprot:g577.t1